jgi:GT2 family glycosyltransferase
MNKYPLVTFVILNWNGRKWLENCLPTVRRVTYPSKEIIVVNNGSTDTSNAFLKKNYPEVKIIELKENVGYAKANNIGVKQAKGKYVLLLNNDTKLTPSFLAPLVKNFEEDPTIGAVQPQMRSLIKPELLDSVVSYLTSTGFMYHFGYMKPWAKEKYKKKRYGFSIKGACFMMRKNDYITLGGLDEDFVCYVEETDLCHRVWLSGKKVMYEPKSIMYHWGGGDMQVMTKDELTMFRSYRNRFILFLKNSSISQLFQILPVLFLFCEVFVVTTLLTGNIKRAIGAQLGILVVPFMLPSILQKRAYIQKHIRKVPDSEITKYVLKNPRLSYYYYFFKNPSRYND